MNMYLPPGRLRGIKPEVSARTDTAPSDRTRVLLTALKMRGVGPVAVRKLARSLSPEIEVSRDIDLFRNLGFRVTEAELKDAMSHADSVLEKCATHKLSVLGMLDDQYPVRLKTVSDAPPIIYIRGEVGALSGLSCAVVGTRHATDCGLKIAHRISAQLCARRYGVVSGLALGIDTAAHEGALASDGVTVAIMAHGLDTVAPSSNRKLAERIISQGGVLVSEHEPGVPARPAEFVRRNRIQSGIAMCSIIVESGEQGGSMHQARFTREQGKPVLAILPENESGPLRAFTHAGGELLVRTGAAVRVRNVDDLIEQVESIAQSHIDRGQTGQQEFHV